MDTHTILHGAKVEFDTGADHGLYWLRDKMQRNGVHDYMKLAKDRKEGVPFMDGDKRKYIMTHDKTTDTFKVTRNYGGYMH